MKNYKRISDILLRIAIILLVVAVVFVGYAVSHPEQSSPINLTATYIVYAIYMIAILICFGGAIVYRIKQKK